MKVLRNKLNGSITKWTKETAALVHWEEVEIPSGTPPSERKKPKKAKAKKPDVPEVSVDDLVFEDQKDDGELSD